jgi:hypothetical protein
VEWLKPTPSLQWTIERGEWQITTHWARVHGRATLVGLDVRSFSQNLDHEGNPMAVGDGLAEVTQKVLRGIPISRVRDETREDMLRHAPGFAEAFGTAAAEEYAAHVATLTTKGRARKRQPPADRALLEQVAALYKEATDVGSKTQAKYVEDRLRAAGVPLSLGDSRSQVRKWIQRARGQGLIPPVGETAQPPTRQTGVRK